MKTLTQFLLLKPLLSLQKLLPSQLNALALLLIACSFFVNFNVSAGVEVAD